MARTNKAAAPKPRNPMAMALARLAKVQVHKDRRRPAVRGAKHKGAEARP